MVVEPFSPSSKLYKSLVIGIPLTTKSGWLFPEREETPRMLILAEAEGPDEELRIFTPDTFPESELRIFEDLILAIC